MSATYYELKDEELHNGLTQKEFHLIFQPILNLSSDTFESLEVFIRWSHPVLGVLPPGLFFNRISGAGLQTDLTDYILVEAINACIQNLQEERNWGVNINLSIEEMRNTRTLQIITRAGKHLPEPDKVCLEISPNLLTAYPRYAKLDSFNFDSDPQAQEVAYLKSAGEELTPYLDAGVTLALDSFSSVAGAINRAGILGMHAVKISKSVLEKDYITEGNYLKECSKQAKQAGVTLIAVGVDNAGLLKHVLKSDINYAQGLLLSAPATLAQLEKADTAEYLEAKRTLVMLSKSETKLRETANTLALERKTQSAKHEMTGQNNRVSPNNRPLAGAKPVFGKKTR